MRKVLGKEFFRIPKDKEPSKLSFGDVVQIIGGPEAYDQAIANAALKAQKGKSKAGFSNKSKTIAKSSSKKVSGKKTFTKPISTASKAKKLGVTKVISKKKGKKKKAIK